MVLTRLAVLLATSLADWTNCLLATGLVVLEEASLQALHKAEVCLATMVAADSTCNITDTNKAHQQFYIRTQLHIQWLMVFLWVMHMCLNKCCYYDGDHKHLSLNHWYIQVSSKQMQSESTKRFN